MAETWTPPTDAEPIKQSGWTPPSDAVIVEEAQPQESFDIPTVTLNENDEMVPSRFGQYKGQALNVKTPKVTPAPILDKTKSKMRTQMVENKNFDNKQNRELYYRYAAKSTGIPYEQLKAEGENISSLKQPFIEAKTVFDQQPDNPQALYDLSAIMLKMGDDTEAERGFQVLLNSEGGDPAIYDKALQGLAMIERSRGNADAAQGLYDQSGEMRPQNLEQVGGQGERGFNQAAYAADELARQEAEVAPTREYLRGIADAIERNVPGLGGVKMVDAGINKIADTNEAQKDAVTPYGKAAAGTLNLLTGVGETVLGLANFSGAGAMFMMPFEQVQNNLPEEVTKYIAPAHLALQKYYEERGEKIPSYLDNTAAAIDFALLAGVFHLAGGGAKKLKLNKETTAAADQMAEITGMDATDVKKNLQYNKKTQLIEFVGADGKATPVVELLRNNQLGIDIAKIESKNAVIDAFRSVEEALAKEERKNAREQDIETILDDITDGAKKGIVKTLEQKVQQATPEQYTESVIKQADNIVAESKGKVQEIEADIKASEPVPVTPAPPNTLSGVELGSDVVYKGKEGKIDRLDTGEWIFIDGEGKQTEIPTENKNNAIEPLEALGIEVLPDIPQEQIIKAMADREQVGEVEHKGNRYFVSTGNRFNPLDTTGDIVGRIMPDGSIVDPFAYRKDQRFVRARKLEIINEYRKQNGQPPQKELFDGNKPKANDTTTTDQTIDRTPDTPIVTEERIQQGDGIVAEPSAEVAPAEQGNVPVPDAAGQESAGAVEVKSPEVTVEEAVTEAPALKDVEVERFENEGRLGEYYAPKGEGYEGYGKNKKTSIISKDANVVELDNSERYLKSKGDKIADESIAKKLGTNRWSEAFEKMNTEDLTNAEITDIEKYTKVLYREAQLAVKDFVLKENPKVDVIKFKMEDEVNPTQYWVLNKNVLKETNKATPEAIQEGIKTKSDGKEVNKENRQEKALLEEGVTSPDVTKEVAAEESAAPLSKENELTPTAKATLESSLEEFSNASDADKKVMVDKVKEQLAINDQGESAIGMGLDADKVAAGKEFLKQTEELVPEPDIEVKKDGADNQTGIEIGDEVSFSDKGIKAGIVKAINGDNLILERKGKEYTVKASDSSMLRKASEVNKPNIKPSFDESIDTAAEALKKKLRPKGLDGLNAKKAGLGVDELIDAAAAIIKKGYRAGKDIEALIDRAMNLVTRKWDKAWGELNVEEFRKGFFNMVSDATKKTLKQTIADSSGLKKPVTEVVVDTAKALKDQLRLEAKAAKEGYALAYKEGRSALKGLKNQYKGYGEKVKQFVDDAVLKGSLTKAQAFSLIKRAAKITTDTAMDNFLSYADKVISDANYTQRMREVKSMQEKVRSTYKGVHKQAVKEFTRVNPEKIPDNLMDDYLKALDELTSRTPFHKTMQDMFFDITQLSKTKDFENVTTFNQATEAFDKIFANEIKSVEDYRKLFRDINALKKRVKSLIEDQTVERETVAGNKDTFQSFFTDQQYKDVMDYVGEKTKAVEEKFKTEIDILKNDMVSNITDANGRINIKDNKDWTAEEGKVIEDLMDNTTDDLRRLDPETLYDLENAIENINNGEVDLTVLHDIESSLVARRAAKEINTQVAKKGKFPFKSYGEAARELKKYEASFVEGILGLGRSAVGAFGKFIISPLERAAGDYTKSIEDAYNVFLEAKKKANVSKDAMDKLGVVSTYLQEYMAQFNPRWKKVDGIGSRDWFNKILSDEGMLLEYEDKAQVDRIRKATESLPKNPDGSVNVKAIYDSVVSKDGKVLSKGEQELFDTMMDFMDKNMRGKQETSNAMRGKPFEALEFYMPRLSMKGKGKIENAYERSNTGVGIKNKMGEERTTQEIRPIETNFEKLFIKAAEGANRDYYFTDATTKIGKTLSLLAKEGDVSKAVAESAYQNVIDRLNYEFESSSSDAFNKFANTLTSARVAYSLSDPVRTLLTELPSSFLEMPTRGGKLSGFKEAFKGSEIVLDLLDFTESPLRLRQNINKMIDVDQASVSGKSQLEKFTYFWAGLPERAMLKMAWMPNFKSEFKSLTGTEFNQASFKNDPQYRIKYRRAIKEASSVSDLITEKIIGATTKLSQAMDIQPIPLMPKVTVSRATPAGKILGFFGNWPRRQSLEFMNGFREFSERIKDGESAASAGTSLYKPLGISLGVLTYAYGSSLKNYIMTSLVGTDKEKEEAKKDWDRMMTSDGVVESMAGGLGSLVGSRYYASGRALTQIGATAAYNLTDDTETKKKIKQILQKNTYTDVLDINTSSKTQAGKDVAYQIAKYVPQFTVVADNVINMAGGAEGVEVLYNRIKDNGIESLTEDEQSQVILLEMVFDTANLIANSKGTALPMKGSIDKYINKLKEDTGLVNELKKVRSKERKEDDATQEGYDTKKEYTKEDIMEMNLKKVTPKIPDPKKESERILEKARISAAAAKYGLPDPNE